jgi:hypothetical protein
VTVIARFNPPSLGTPLSHAVLESVRAEAPAPKEIDRIERHQAVGAAAICDDVATFAQVTQTCPEFCQRHGDGARNMCSRVLLTWSDVDHSDLAGAYATHEFVVVDRLQRATLLEILACDLLDLGET